jgi:hypothetical protein
MSPNFRTGHPLQRRYEVMLIVLLISIIVVIHGAIPIINAPNLSVQSLLLGEAKCISENSRPWGICQQLGYPVGFNPLVIGYPITIIMAFLYKLFSIPLIDCLQLLNCLCIGFGFFPLYLFLKQQTSNILMASVVTFGFYASLFMIGMKAYFSMYLGFLLFPLFAIGSIFLFLKFIKNIAPFKPLILAFCVFIQLSLLSVSIMLDGYSYVMSIIVALVFLFGMFLSKGIREKPKSFLIPMIFWSCLLILPGILYKLLIFSGSSMNTSSIDFIRGQGIDIATLFIPTQRYMLSNLLGLGPLGWNSYAFYGDGMNANYNYLGIFTFIFTVIGIFTILHRSSGKRQVGSISLIILIVGLVFSFGPSFKVFNVRSESQNTQVSFDDYLMSPEEAVISLPTAFLFRLPVINTMRAAYRWQLLVRFAMTFFIAVFLSRLFQRNTIFAIIISFLILIENIPSNFLKYQGTYASNRQQGKLFTVEVVDKLKPYIKGQDRVLFLPAENDYLIGLIIPFTGGETYNVFFDKELGRIIALQPEPIIAARTSFDNGSLTSTVVCELFNQGLVDTVIFNEFSMRWDSYSWPPTPATVQGYRLKIEGLDLKAIKDLDVTTLDLSIIVKPGHGLPLNCK